MMPPTPSILRRRWSLWAGAGAASLALPTWAQFANVPYRGSSPALIDLISGQVNLMISTLASAAVHHKSGKVRMLATTAPKRHPDFPDPPTLAELGVRGMDYEQWFGVLAPANTPKAIVDKLNAAMAKAALTPNAKERLAGLRWTLRREAQRIFGVGSKQTLLAGSNWQWI